MFVDNLTYRHSKEAPLFFDGLSFELEPGKIHALQGKNGSGKTVLLKILSQKENTFLVDQRFDKMLADQFSFEDNLRFAALRAFPSIFSRLPKAESYIHILEHFNIDPKTLVHKLSGGERQILSLLMCLQRKVDVLLLDEPTATLDEENARMVFNFLTTLANEGMTLLVVCHDKELMEEYTTGKTLTLQRGYTGLRNLV